MIALAVVFIALLFFIKHRSTAKNIERNGGLTYDHELVADLIQRDTDGDSVPDWEESLWGTNPTKTDTNSDGISDSVEVAKLKADSNLVSPDESGEKLSQTDKFSRELFSTIATLNQAGNIDQDTIDQLSESLSKQIQNYPVRKVFKAADLKIKNDSSSSAVQKYNIDLGNVYKKYPLKGNVPAIMQKFVESGDEPDVKILSELDPILNQTQNLIEGMMKVEVPEDLSGAHLNLMNSLERVVENLTDIKLYDSDAIIAMGAIIKYGENSDLLDSALLNLNNAIVAKMK